MGLSFNIQHFDSLDSTNKEVLRQVKAGAHEGLVVVAAKQTDGKGRLNRKWDTIDHALAMSVLLRPNISPTLTPQLSLVAAVAVQEALALFAPHTGIKWPNDLLIHGEKVAGILTEMSCTKNQVEAVVLGIGINVETPKTWAENMRTPPTSLNQHSNHQVRKESVLNAVLESLDKWYDIYIQHGFSPIKEAWWAKHMASKQTVSVFDGESYIQGIAMGLDDDGALRLLVNGEDKSIIAGDVSLMEQK